jgi:hypothetical protein
MVVQIPLPGGCVALVDDVDSERVSGPKWTLSQTKGKSYVVHREQRWEDGRTVFVRVTYLHRFLLGAPEGIEVDHLNGDGLDNRRTNLRLVTHRQNQQNRRGANRNSGSGIRNVYWHERKGKWRVSVMVDGRSRHFGYFDELDEAAAAAEDARRRCFDDAAGFGVCEAEGK